MWDMVRDILNSGAPSAFWGPSGLCDLCELRGEIFEIIGRHHEILACLVVADNSPPACGLLYCAPSSQWLRFVERWSYSS